MSAKFLVTVLAGYALAHLPQAAQIIVVGFVLLSFIVGAARTWAANREWKKGCHDRALIFGAVFASYRAGLLTRDRACDLLREDIDNIDPRNVATWIKIWKDSGAPVWPFLKIAHHPCR